NCSDGRRTMQRLGQALANGNLGQARYEFEALVNDVPELGQADPMSHPQFTSLGRALQALDLAGAREAFAHLEHEVPSLNHHPNPSPGRTTGKIAERICGSGSAETPGLDVTA